MTGEDSLKARIHAFKYVEEGEEPSIAAKLVTLKCSSQVSNSQAIDQTDQTDHLLDLAPSLAENLRIVFVGYNPGIQSSVQQHHYAHFSNHFWKLFNGSKLLLSVLRIHSRDDLDRNDRYLCTITDGVDSLATPACDYDLARYGIGFTDLVLRCTRTAQELDLQEKLQNVPRLISEINSSNAENVVFIGKGIWQVVVSAMAKELGIKVKLSKLNFNWGQQQEKSGPNHRTYDMVLTHFKLKLPGACKVYVLPNTSGLVASPNKATKQELWARLSRDIKQEASS